MKVKLKNRLRKYRSKNNLTQIQLACKVGVCRETIGHIENGRYNLSLVLAYKIAQALNTNIEDLFLFEEETEEKAAGQGCLR